MSEVVKLKPITAKLKSKIHEAGERWIVVRRAENVICLNGPGVLVTPENKQYDHFIRWVSPEAIEE